MRVVEIAQKQPDANVIAELRDLLALAESGDLEYIAYVAVSPSTVYQTEAGIRDPYQIHGRLYELASQIISTEADE